MKTVKEYAALVNKALESLPQLHEEPNGLYAPIRYALEGGGKRLRPVLALGAAEALGADPEKAMAPALAMEIYHNFTLLHDDIMDQSPTRHGRPSVHCRWDDATAILSGDAMLTMAVQMLIQTGFDDATKIRMIDLFNKVAMDVYQGQQYDMDFERQERVSPEEYIKMIALKTAVLLAGSCQMGVLAAGGSDEQFKAFFNYGFSLGIAFQLQDDLLDSFGDPATFGKPIGGDIINDKKTLLSILARRDKPLQMAEAMTLSGEDRINAVKAIYEQLGLPAYVDGLVKDNLEDAVNAIKEIGLSNDAFDFFKDFAERLIGRQN